MKEFIYSGANYKACRYDESFGEGVRKRFLPKKPSEEELYFAKFIMNFLYCLPNGADPETLSAKLINNYYKFRGEEHFVAGGYTRITDALALGGYPILLEHDVNEVNYEHPSTVVVSTAGGKSFKTHHVIATLPLGVLQHGDVKFMPELPKRKLEAI